ncbi:energy-coupling factor transporter transmembrane component T [Mollicutes bacterium LVI A0078]|nr:energy-coupling factor transporter transmembrane component T [Mollicutes bacterium LVI A0075]WOO91379.1 energy-coupling factor transporter transmembrane component T [Mollicutes bacterium LVI A0078]
MNTSDLFFHGDSFFHKLDASIKLLSVIVWTIFIFKFQDIRVFALFLIVGLIMLYISKVPAKLLKAPFIFIVLFTIFNSIFLLVITPQYGSELTGTYTYVIQTDHYAMTYETVFYMLTLSMKYLALLPITLLFVFTTHPTQFASSLNRIGVNYKIAYSVNLSLRYIPTVVDEMWTIKNALMIKGINIDDETNKIKKLKLYLNLLIPLMKNSIEKIDTISNAMDLRSFGYGKKRTWYRFEKFQTRDYAALATLVILMVLFLLFFAFEPRVFYYPFI